jgi:hypothetical protein
MSEPALASSFTDIESAVDNLTGVMGPADAALRASLLKIIGAGSFQFDELHSALNAIVVTNSESNRNKLIDGLIRNILKPSAKLGEKQVRDARTALHAQIAKAKLAHDFKGIGKDQASRLEQSTETFTKSIKLICELLDKMLKLEDKIIDLDIVIDGIDSEADEPDADGQAAVRLFRTGRYAKRDNCITEKRRCEAKIIDHFDETLGGMRSVSKHDKMPLKFPKNFEKVSAQPIIDAMKAYMSHRAQEYFAILPYINHIMHSYDPRNGTYFKPPDKHEGISTVPDIMKEAYTPNRVSCYTDLSSRTSGTWRYQRLQQHSGVGSTSK